jgi:5-methyltetrahydropteroyltriglutamate--homocysteine methyltransferase
LFTHTIGSLPRPQVVRDLIARRAGGPSREIDAALDEMTAFAIRLQEEAGLDVVSDGEWRRSQYIDEFLDRIGAFERIRRFHHAGEEKLTRVVVRRIEPREPVFASDARFLAAHTARVRKFALPGPFLIAVRYWHPDYSGQAYRTMPEFMHALAAILRREAEALVDAGIDIVQIDEPALTYFCDRRLTSGEPIHDERLRREWNVEREMPEAIEAINAVVENLSAEIHLHCCHSVYKRQSDVEGDYRPILPFLAKAAIDRINLEFAYRGTGTIDDLRLLPPGLHLGAGVVDVRTEKPQEVEEIVALGAAAVEVIGPERVALNPDCGFAPGAGEPPSIDEAYEKLKRMVEAARRLRARFGAPAPQTVPVRN